MLVEIALQWTDIFMDKRNNEIHENWYTKNIDKTKVVKYPNLGGTIYGF